MKDWIKTILYAIATIVLFILFVYMTSFIVWGHEYTPSDIVSIGKVVYHEADNQSELGKRLVIDTILNRVESDGFPNTIEEVLSQPGQYCNSSKYPPKDYYRLVAEELYFRTNSEVLWYRTKKYHKYGVPIIKEGDHYFSGR
jgi:N-acetylmuramoyl-L-alanine amidase